MVLSSELKIGFGTTVLARGVTGSGIDGIGRYTKEIFDRLDQSEALRLLPFQFGSQHSFLPDNRKNNLIRFSVGSFPSLFFDLSFTGIKKLQSQIDILHATDHLIPKLTATPVIATIMDAIPLAHPEWVGTRFRYLRNYFWKKSAGFADHVITISNHSKKDLIEYFGIDEQKISVIPLGVDNKWATQFSSEELADIRARYRVPSGFFVFIGTLQPRKNVVRIIDAHRSLPRVIRESFPLLIIGRQGWQCEDVLQRLSICDNSTRWLKYVPENDLPKILHCASALVFPSLHEGFGLTILEAFAAGVPVITSNLTSMPEVAGDAALLVDPYDYENIAAAMQSVIEDTVLARNLRLKGIVRVRDYSWDRSAQLTKALYREVVTNFASSRT